MLEGVLYEVIERKEGGAIVRTLPESPIYAAHFPGYPITPGVCLVQMVLELMGKEMTGAKDIKFVTPLMPDTRVHFTWTHEGAVQATLDDGTLCAKMSLECR